MSPEARVHTRTHTRTHTHTHACRFLVSNRVRNSFGSFQVPDDVTLPPASSASSSSAAAESAMLSGDSKVSGGGVLRARSAVDAADVHVSQPRTAKSGKTAK